MEAQKIQGHMLTMLKLVYMLGTHSFFTNTDLAPSVAKTTVTLLIVCVLSAVYTIACDI